MSPGDAAQATGFISFTCEQPFQGLLEQNQKVGRVSNKTQVHNVDIELAVVLGRCLMPMQNLLKMGRGAVIPLDTKETDQLWILAAGHPIARGEITIQGDRLCITVTEPADVHEFNAVT